MSLTKVTQSMIYGSTAYLMDWIPAGTVTATTDCTTWIQAAITETAGHKELIVPGDVQFMVSNLDVYAGTHITVDGPTWTRPSSGVLKSHFLFTAPGRNVAYAMRSSGSCADLKIKGLVIEGDTTGTVGFSIPIGTDVNFFDIDLSVRNFQYGMYCVGSLWSGKLRLWVETAYIGFVRTSANYNTSVDMDFRFSWCFHGAQMQNSVYCQMWGYMEACGLSASDANPLTIPAGWMPANEAPIMVDLIGAGQLTIHYLGAENTNSIYLHASDYATIDAKALYFESSNTDTWTYNAARNNNLNIAYQGLFSAHDGGFIDVGNFVFTHLTADGYDLPAVRLSYMFRIKDDGVSSIKVSNSYIHIQDYWLTDLPSRLISDGSGQINATLFDSTPFVSGYYAGTLTRSGFTEVLGGGAITSTYQAYQAGRLVTLFITLTCTGAATIAAASGAAASFTGFPVNSTAKVGGTWTDITSYAATGAISMGNTPINTVFVVTGWTASGNTRTFTITYPV